MGVVGRGLRVEGWFRFFIGTTLLVELFICNGFWGDIVLAQRCCLVSTNADCHNWREDIVVPYVTTYAIPLRTAFASVYNYKILA